MSEQQVQLYAAISFLVIGVSHLVRPKEWVAFFQALAARGTVGVFAEGFVVLNFGAFIAGFHNVWHGPALGLTIIGWGQLLKGVMRFVFPQTGLRVIQRISPERAWEMQVGGVLALAISGYLWWLRFGA